MFACSCLNRFYDRKHQVFLKMLKDQIDYREIMRNWSISRCTTLLKWRGNKIKNKASFPFRCLATNVYTVAWYNLPCFIQSTQVQHITSVRHTDSRFIKENRDLKQTRTATPTSGGQKNISSSFIKNIFSLVTLMSLFSLKNRCRTLVLEMSVTFWRQRGNGAVEVSFESRTAQMSALFHIFTCAFCLLQLVLLLYRRCRRHPRLFCLRSLICEEDIGTMASTTRMHFARVFTKETNTEYNKL